MCNIQNLNQDFIAFVYCAGLGTRLRPYTNDIPKPLLRFKNNKRIVDYTLDSLINVGFRKAFINASYGFELFDELKKDYRDRLEIHIVREDSPSGHGGVLLKNIDLFEGFRHLVTFNGDTIISFNIMNFLLTSGSNTAGFLSSEKVSLPKNLICKSDLELIGLVGPTNEYIYLENRFPKEPIYKNYLGVSYLPITELKKIATRDEVDFLGMFGKDDLVETLVSMGVEAIVVEADLADSGFVSINTIDEFNRAESELNA